MGSVDRARSSPPPRPSKPPPAPPSVAPLEPELEILGSDDLIESSTPTPQVGRRSLGPYEIIAEIARGGMGVVYLCRRAGEAGFERLFAVKAMHPHLARDREFVAMLIDEARLAARIHHHNVASVLDLGVGEDGYFLAMPYVEGCSLAQLLARNRTYRPPSLIVPIVIGALNGLHAAHTVLDDDGREVGLIHRDVSPQNILVGVDGDARITDFGVAKARARISSTEPGFLKGKLCYAAPEMIERAAALDHRADVFAAGVVLWSALTGRSLFQGASDAETIHRVLTLDVPPPSRVGLAPPAIFDPIILRALARDPADRFASAAAMAAALRAAAIASGMLGAPTRVACWVRDTFAAEIDQRQRLIRDAVHADPAAGVVAVLPRFVGTPATTATPSAAAATAAAPTTTAAEELPATATEIARFAAAVVAAFVVGSLATLWARGLL